jgi:hypothetical protein
MIVFLGLWDLRHLYLMISKMNLLPSSISILFSSPAFLNNFSQSQNEFEWIEATDFGMKT